MEETVPDNFKKPGNKNSREKTQSLYSQDKSIHRMFIEEVHIPNENVKEFTIKLKLFQIK